MKAKRDVVGILVAGALVATGLGTSPGFAQGTPVRPPAPKYERTEDSPYLALHWNCKRTDAGALLIEGLATVPPWVATNIYHGELTLVGLDAKGKRQGEATGYLPSVLVMSSSAPFSVTLPLTGGEARVDLHYAYDFIGNRGGEGQKFTHRPWHVVPVGSARFNWSVPSACPAG